MVSIICGRWSLWSRYLGEYRNKGKKDECLRRFEYRTDRSLLVWTQLESWLVPQEQQVRLATTRSTHQTPLVQQQVRP